MPGESPAAPRRLRAGFEDSPIGLDRVPLLTWEVSEPQRGLRVELDTDGGDSAAFEELSPEPRFRLRLPLAATTRYRWRVRSLSDAGWSEWSENATFETAPLTESGWLGARWIGAGPIESPDAPPAPAPTFSVRFSAEVVGRHRLYLSGLGIANARLNGEPIGSGVMDPPPSAYDRVVFYRAFDLEPLLRAGTNTLSITLGRGFFAMDTPTAFNWHVAAWRSEPQLRAVLLDLDRPGHPVLVSDEHWTVSTSTVRGDSLYAGEVHDARASPTSGRAVAVNGPSGELLSCRQPTVTRRGRVAITAEYRLAPDRVRFDLAANVAGMLSIATSDPNEPTLVLSAGEKLADDGGVVATDGAIPVPLQRSELRRMPADRRVDLDLSYAGLRYLEVAGTTHSVIAEVDRVSAAPASIGEFSCSDDRLNRLHEITRLTLENCLQGTPIDTPLYEKQGYTGDAQLLAETFAYNYWMAPSLAAWLRAGIFPSQSADGSLPGIAPTPAGNWIFDTPSPAWDAAIFELPATLLRHYGDVELVRDAMPTLRRYLDYLRDRFPDGVIPVGLGDWNPPGHVMPPESPIVLSTAYHARFLDQAALFARRIGEPAEAAGFARRAGELREEFHARFWRDDGFYSADADAGYRETDSVLALAFDLVPAGLCETVAARVERGIRDRGGHLDTGMVGTRFLLRELSRAGRSSLAFEIARASGYPGWQHWIENGATTLYENWELDGRSHDHAMFGSIGEWFFADVAGLSPAREAWGAIRFSPHFPADDEFEVAATIETIVGAVSVRWRKTGDRIAARLIAPVGVPIDIPEEADVTVLTVLSTRVGDFAVAHDFELAIVPMAARRGS